MKVQILLLQIWETAFYNYTCTLIFNRNNDFVENVWATNWLCLFFFRCINIEQVKRWLQSIHPVGWVVLLLWGNTSNCGPKEHKFDAQFWQKQLCLLFCLLLLCFICFGPKTWFVMKCSHSFCNAILYSIYLTYC